MYIHTYYIHTYQYMLHIHTYKYTHAYNKLSCILWIGRKIKTAEKLKRFRTPRTQSSLPNVEDNKNSTESFYELFAGNDMARASSTTTGDPNLIPNPTNMEEESQLSNDSDARSIAFNPKSEQQLSLKVCMYIECVFILLY